MPRHYPARKKNAYPCALENRHLMPSLSRRATQSKTNTGMTKQPTPRLFLISFFLCHYHSQSALCSRSPQGKLFLSASTKKSLRLKVYSLGTGAQRKGRISIPTRNDVNEARRNDAQKNAKVSETSIRCNC
jgi:hypothetical protein